MTSVLVLISAFGLFGSLEDDSELASLPEDELLDSKISLIMLLTWLLEELDEASLDSTTSEPPQPEYRCLSQSFQPFASPPGTILGVIRIVPSELPLVPANLKLKERSSPAWALA